MRMIHPCNKKQGNKLSNKIRWLLAKVTHIMIRGGPNQIGNVKPQ